MAYNSTWNPDALPAHAEPDQAAQMLAYQQQQQQQQSQIRPQHSPQSSTNLVPQPLYANKPPPPLPGAASTPQQQTQPLNIQRRPSPSAPVSNNNSYNTSSGGILAPSSLGYDYSTSPSRPAPNRPPSRPPGVPGNTDPSLWPLFKAVDKRGTGQLTEEELRAALVNGVSSSFDPHTVRMMIRMFDFNRNGTISFEEFCGLWGFLAAWRALFDRFDEDRSGSISFNEYSNALVSFGYHLSPNFVTMLYRAYDKQGTNQMSFDIFVQSCISLKRMTDVFKKYDTDRDGYITLSFEDFLTGMFTASD
ncbi:hypothetical protein MMC25_007619 [Agyrium rufum]|nr:hypothetical protein [Agyrium rufum]